MKLRLKWWQAAILALMLFVVLPYPVWRLLDGVGLFSQDTQNPLFQLEFLSNLMLAGILISLAIINAFILYTVKEKLTHALVLFWIIAAVWFFNPYFPALFLMLIAWSLPCELPILRLVDFICSQHLSL